MKVYHLRTCDTCRAALAALSSFNPERIEIRDAGLTRDQIDHLLAAVGADALVNRRSRTWRDLPEAERARPAAELLRAHPLVMKRPVILHEGAVLVGWGRDVRTRFGL